ncbi:RNA-binding protein [Trypanosoma rangeli]|uniref:RNA-binding protein n=1 Tax=Trypanosoma rangeli TaxID=5698 RepID=A0A3R7KE41_TRYRA|nr:RNA-binding protein [Trypanosoma rangeli]RNF06152.1 RNA-binding protein [Trypanosoma rangeli]|eukprot:RNF06152.1 RNA-binding protein [Trypanosoma rangeli]
MDEVDSNPLSASAAMREAGAVASASSESDFFFGADVFAEKLFLDDENDVSSEDNNIDARYDRVGSGDNGTLMQAPRSETQSRTNLFISNLPHKMEQQDLEKLFSPYGQILSAAVMRNIHTGNSLGTAFVRYTTTKAAMCAIEAMSGKRVNGRAIIVQWAWKQHDGTPVGEARKKICKLFVRNIPLDISTTDLEEMFSLYGPIKSVSIHKDTAPATDRRSERHIAFITYLVAGAAVKAAEAVHNTRPFPTCGKVPLMVKLAEDIPQHNHHGTGSNNVNNALKGQRQLRSGGGRTSPGQESGYSGSPAQGCLPVGDGIRGLAVAPGSFVPVMTSGGGLMLPASVPGAVMGTKAPHPWGAPMLWPQGTGVPFAFYSGGVAATPAKPHAMNNTLVTVPSRLPVSCVNYEGFASPPTYTALLCPATLEASSETRADGLGGNSTFGVSGFPFFLGKRHTALPTERAAMTVTSPQSDAGFR